MRHRIAITRKRRRLALMGLGISLLLVGGCSSMLLGSGGSAGKPIGNSETSARPSASDQRIVDTIRARYAADSELAASALRVTSTAGVVTLRGDVDDYALRDRALRLANDVAGVGRVVNQIGINR